MDEDDRIRQRAYRLWVEEGQPEGQAEQHWQMARQLIAEEEAGALTLKPNPLAQGGDGRVIEEARIQENLGEFPTLTDQGEEVTTPKARKSKPKTAEAASTPKAAAAADKKKGRAAKLAEMLTRH